MKHELVLCYTLAGKQLTDYVKEFFSITSSIINNDDNVSKEDIIAFIGTKNDDSENAAVKKR